MRRFGDATAASRRILELDPDYQQALLALAASLALQGELDEALAMLTSASNARFDPRRTDARFRDQLQRIRLPATARPVDSRRGRTTIV